MAKLDFRTTINAINTKDYKFYNELPADQKKDVAIFPLMQTVGALNADQPTKYHVRYILNVNDYVNKNLWDISNKHPELAWLTLITAVDYRKIYYSRLTKNSKKTKLENFIAELNPTLKMSDVKMMCKLITKDQLSQLLDDLGYSKKEKDEFLKSVVLNNDKQS